MKSANIWEQPYCRLDEEELLRSPKHRMNLSVKSNVVKRRFVHTCKTVIDTENNQNVESFVLTYHKSVETRDLR